MWWLEDDRQDACVCDAYKLVHISILFIIGRIYQRIRFSVRTPFLGVGVSSLIGFAFPVHMKISFQ